MHGTFRSRIEHGAGVTVRFDPPAALPPAKPARWRANLAALLAGVCVAALPVAWQPAWNAEDRPAARAVAPAVPAPVLAAAPAVPRLAAPAKAKVPKRLAPPSEPATAAAIELAEAPPQPALPVEDVAPAPTPPAIPRLAMEPLPPPPVAVNLPAPAPRLAALDAPVPVAPEPPPPAEAAQAPPAQALRQVDVPQIAESDARSLRIPQLREPGLAVGGEPMLAAKVAAMQVTPLPPVRLREADRAALLAEAPTRMVLRIGGSALGKVDFRMSDARTIDVRLSGLLDLLAGHYDAAEFARLRNSAAADAYVSFDQLRALGLNVRYDPVYDELRING